MNAKDKKKALENKLREIEKKKKKKAIQVDKINSVQPKEELVNLKEELKQLKYKKKTDQKKRSKNKLSNNTEVNAKVKAKKTLADINETVKDDVKKVSKPQKSSNNKKEDFKQVVQKKINENISLKTVEINKKDTDNNSLKKIKNQSALTQKKDNTFIEKKEIRKKVVIQKNDVNHTTKVVIYFSIAFAIAILAYLVKLNIDLKKKQEKIKLQEKERIDYSKKDAVFKEVEEDEEPMELQKIK